MKRITDEEALAMFNQRVKKAKPEKIKAIVEETIAFKTEKIKKPRTLSPEAQERQKQRVKSFQLQYKAERVGLTAEEATSKWEEHPKLCEICGNPPKEDRWLCMDHDHSTGKFRGWLCEKCNSGLGFFKDDPTLLLLAIEYLINKGDTV